MTVIPKTIHYCWFGGNPFSSLIEDCITSWKKFAPDYTIKLWNESNSPLESSSFVKDAFLNKKWAFVSDYVRLHALHNEGGVYLDTDMLLVKSLDPLLEHACFLGFESESEYEVNCAIIGSEAGHPFIDEILNYYHGLKFNIARPQAIPKITTGILNSHGLKAKNSLQVVSGVHVYPVEYFYPWSFDEHVKGSDYRDFIVENTHAVHLWDFSWKTELDYLRMRRYDLGFPLVWDKIRKNPLQSPGFYARLGKYTLRYLCKRLFQAGNRSEAEKSGK